MSQKGFSSVAIILIVVGVLLAGGVTWYWQNKISEQSSQPSITKQLMTEQTKQQPAAEQQSIAEQQLSDEIANWKTYRNEEYGFEVKYPQEWKFEESKRDKILVIVALHTYATSSDCGFNIATVMDIDLNESDIEWHRKNNYKETGYTINSVPAIWFSKSLTSAKTGKELQFQNHIFFNKNLKFYKVSHWCPEDNYRVICSDVFGQILPTFKFTK